MNFQYKHAETYRPRIMSGTVFASYNKMIILKWTCNRVYKETVLSQLCQSEVWWIVGSKDEDPGSFAGFSRSVQLCAWT